MNRYVWSLVPLCVLALVFALPSVAGAAECGTVSAGAEEPLLGTLKVEESSDTEFAGSDKRLLLRFEVEGCTISSADGIRVEPESSELEEGVFGEAKPIPRGKQLVIQIPVDEGQFDAGKFNAIVAITGSTINNTNQKVSVQKTTDALWPTVIALLCAIGGFVAAFAVAMFKVEKPREINWGLAFCAFVTAAVASGSIWKASYVDVDVWVFELSTVVALTVGCASAAAGAAAAWITNNKAIQKKST